MGVLFRLKEAREVILFAQLEKFLWKTSQETLITFMTMYVGVFFSQKKLFAVIYFVRKLLWWLIERTYVDGSLFDVLS